MSPLHHQRGLSLVELMVAIALGALLLAGATTLFVNNRATYELTHDMARMQENARFALETISGDLRMAGYVGCFNGPGTNDVYNGTGATSGELWDPSNPIEGFDSDDADVSWQPSGHTGDTVNDADLDVTTFGARVTLPGGGTATIPTDGISVRYLDGDRADADADGTPDFEVVNSVYEGALNISLNNVNFADLALQADQPAGLSDCGSASVFLIDNTPADDGFVTASELNRAYDTVNRALFSRLNGVRYFVRNNDVGIPALYRGSFFIDPADDTLKERADELVDGVESMQILYGLDTDNDRIVDTVASSDEFDDWAAVVSVRVSLLMRSVRAFTATPKQGGRFQVGDIAFCTNDLAADANCDVALPLADGHSRRVYETTVRVRNY